MNAGLYNREFYNAQMGGSYKSALKIVPIIRGMIDVNSVLDVGCGVGSFLRAFQDNGVEDIFGIDGPYVSEDQLMIDKSKFYARDLTSPCFIHRRFDLAVSVEVAEHLPLQVADAFVKMLCLHSDVVLFSAAIPAQGGEGHVNERWPSYWAEKFSSHGFKPFDVIRDEIWNDDEVEYWYAQNCIIYANETAINSSDALRNASGKSIAYPPRSLVHPKLYEIKCDMVQHCAGTFEELARSGEAFRIVKDGNGQFNVRLAKNSAG